MRTKGFCMRFTVSILAALLVALLAAACAEPSATSTPTSTPAVTQTPTSTSTPASTSMPESTSTATPETSSTPASTSETFEPMELIMSHTVPSMAPLGQLSQEWSDKITEMSDGRLTFTWYWNASLIPQGELLKALRTGVADGAAMPIGFEENCYLNDIARIPFIGFPSMSAGTEIYRELLDIVPELRAEYEGVEPFGAYMTPCAHLHMVNQIVKSPEDLKGKKIISSLQVSAMIDAAGGAPVEVELPDYYTSIERNLVEGVVDHFPVLDAFGIIPIIPHHTIFGDGGIMMMMQAHVINSEIWVQFPDDIKKMFYDLEPWLIEEELARDQLTIDAAISTAEELGHEFVYLTPEEIQPWVDLAQPYHEEWIEDVEARGLPARTLYDEAKRLIAEYNE